MSIANKKDRDLSYDANEDLPVFKVNSVLDWLEYRKHQTVEHQKLIKLKQQSAINKLEELKKEQEKEDNDWATSKIKKLNKLIKY
ncbi:UNKNOWN [Stylonychia lemnae]|uniref:Uncharacterized protein n=1 Tax=Stylonychia lemnae TaxID=5949 RepID=A0A078B032_STYLE|nr:UNKNOWN [Stylonychia lemnae]|eukprot:CDW88030.1 UNKNOWN [Stylonychia lemnae]